MTSINAGRGADREGSDSTARIDGSASSPATARLTPEQCSYVRFVLDVVGLLAARHGFEPDELCNARTGASFGPSVARMRKALERSDSDGYGGRCVDANGNTPSAGPPA